MWPKLVVVFLAAFAAQVASATCYFSEPISLGHEGDIELQQYVNEEDDSFTIKVTYSGGQSYVAVGLNDNGGGSMTPSTAFIGQMSSGVRTHRLTTTGIVVSDDEMLTDATFVQEDGVSTLLFTQSLSYLDRNLTEPTVWIYSVGYEGNLFTGHSQYGNFMMELTPNCTSDGDDDMSVAAAGSLFPSSSMVALSIFGGLVGLFL
eukprot:Nitzschia sp. Nitz4//scaffold265_size26576//19238//19849//NITZ4_008251-RA/size26576-processed-gene-0.13-mRNA-1//1//CDS//3329544849//5570//frame0